MNGLNSVNTVSMNTELERTCLVWDGNTAPPRVKWTLVLWQSFVEGNDNLAYSMPSLLEEQAEEMRSCFLAWLYELGETHISGKRLVEHLELRPGFSYWWMTLITQKANAYASPQIVDAVKMLAFEKLVRKFEPWKIILASNNRSLACAFKLWCKTKGILFEWRSLKSWDAPVTQSRSLYYAARSTIRSVLKSLNYLKEWYSLRQVTRDNLPKSSITFCSYLDNLDPSAASNGRFYSRYWTALPDFLAGNGVSTNWIQFYLQDAISPTARHAKMLIKRFNNRIDSRQYHMILDSALCLPVIIGWLCDYGRIILMHFRLKKVCNHFTPAGSKVDLWPFFEQDWLDSMFGVTARFNCLFLNLFEYALKGLSKQRMGFYLQENQAWEIAFIHAWKSAGHGRLIGVPHVPLRFWDLRYFFDPRTYERSGKNDFPMPDKVALNGPLALSMYRNGGYPVNQLVTVEALRYLYLVQFGPSRTAVKEQSGRFTRVLVLGDYTPSVTHQQMQWLADAASVLPPEIQYLVKPHPNCPVKPKDYPSIQFEITDAPLAELLGDCDVAYTSNSTAAAVDAYSAGVPVISMLDGNSLNMSSLKGLKGVRFVSTPFALAEALSHRAALDNTATREAYFTLDSAIPRWRALLYDSGRNKSSYDQ